MFPLIGKPDIGMRGLSVKKLDTTDDIIDYALNSQGCIFFYRSLFRLNRK
jgi:hypothetical protein